MTLLVALKGSDGLVMASDSRGTFGDPRGVTAQNDSQKKAFILTNHTAALLAGSGELGANVVREAQTRIKAHAVEGVTQVQEVFRTTVRELYGAWFPHLQPAVPPGMPAIARPDLAIIIGGYDASEGGAYDQGRMYQLVSALDFPPMLHEYGFALAGIAQYALYLLNRLYEPQRALEELTALAVYVITETASQDGKVGGPIQVLTVQPDAGCTELSETAVQEVLVLNEGRSRSLKDSFYRRAVKPAKMKEGENK